ncbi:GIY-YIG nuclease family protein [Streptomyces sp. UH6]|uniref:GIY-YIG nuclease family protein n=1 Tax=Streptomyces sp. UH6 TaxID=2748379 RepID=UPI0035BC3663
MRCANPTSTQNLRKRVRYHCRGNAAGSTLRLTLGCLPGLELRRVGSGKRMTFGKAGGKRAARQLIGRTERAVACAVSGPSEARSTGTDDGRQRPPDAPGHGPTPPELTSPDRPRSPGNDRSALFVTPPERSSRAAFPSGKVAVREGGRGAARGDGRPVRFGPARHDLCRFAHQAWQHPPEEQKLPTVRQVGGDPWQRAEKDAEAARAAAD